MTNVFHKIQLYGNDVRKCKYLPRYSYYGLFVLKKM